MGTMTMKSTRGVLGHSLLLSLVRLHRSLIRLLRTSCFARALRCAYLFARSLAHSEAHEKEAFSYALNAVASTKGGLWVSKFTETKDICILRDVRRFQS